MSNNSFTLGKDAGNGTSHLATPGDHDEPPAEWASSTLSALGPVTSEPNPADKPIEPTHPAWTDSGSTTSTPGHYFPGSYPGPTHKGDVLKEDTNHVKEVTAATAAALGTAKEYVVSAGETVGGYLPERVAAYLPTATNSTRAESRDLDVHPTSPDPLVKSNNVIDDHSETMRSQSSTTIPKDAENQLLDATKPTGGASIDASTRSLAGSSRFGTQEVTPGTSVFGGASGVRSPSPKEDVVGRSPQLSQALVSDFDAAGTERKGDLVESGTVPQPSQVHMSDSPVTTGREYPLSLKEGSGQSAKGVVGPGTGEKTDSDIDTVKGKARESGGAPTTSAGPHVATSTVSDPTATSQKPADLSTAPPPMATTTNDTAATTTTSPAAPSTTTDQKPTTTTDTLAAAATTTTTTTTKPATTADDKPSVTPTTDTPKKSKHRFFEKLKSKFEGKDSGRAKGKN